MTINLHRYTENGITLEKAIADCTHLVSEATALLYSPKECRFGLLVDKVIVDELNQPIALTDVYEARLFNANWELRWLKTPGGTGRAVLLGDSATTAAPPGGWNVERTFPVIETIDHSYLLWGEFVKVDDDNDRWTRLAAARIGKLDVPVALAEEYQKERQRVLLWAKEYLQECDFGNVCVVEERLIGLKAQEAD